MCCMKITLYKSALCPRCHFARKSLNELLADRDDIELEIIDILTSPARTLRDGVKLIPAIKAGDKKLSGVYLNKNDIAIFLEDAARG